MIQAEAKRKELIRTIITEKGIKYISLYYSALWSAWVICINDKFRAMRKHRTDALKFIDVLQ